MPEIQTNGLCSNVMLIKKGNFLSWLTMTQSKDFWRNQINSNLPVLDAGTRIWEVVCGLVMVLTFTGSISAATAGREDVKVILWAALGCNLAWGIVDALMYLMSVWLEREQGLKALRIVRQENLRAGTEVIKGYLPPVIASIVRENCLAEIRSDLVKLPEPPSRAFLLWGDLKNSLLILFLVFASTFPVAVPFLFRIDTLSAMRLSNGIVLILLFSCGVIRGGQTGYKRILFGLMLALIGVVLVGITMALGG